MVDTITITVNGGERTVTVPPRTQLAEVLRDHLDLTGTHLGCEQGVCGACTVMVDGRPVRSCIVYAGSCDGAVVETVEGEGDTVVAMLKDSFSRHHALQCGFCTPGMLTTARDILARHGTPDEALVRRELSGNLCRCTGYQGIVDAIMDVGARLGDGKEVGSPDRSDAGRKSRFKPFEPDADARVAAEDGPQAKGGVSQDGDWTVVTRSFSLNHSAGSVWGLFADVSRVAACVPGAAVSDVSDEGFSGVIEVSFGPIKARFEGSGTYSTDLEARRGRISGRGADRNGQSNANGEMHYAVRNVDGNASRVEVELRFRIEGPLAQFNRPELVAGFADFLLQRFIANCNVVLAGGTAGTSNRIGVFTLILGVLKAYFRRRAG